MELTGGFENVDTDLFDMCPDPNGIYKIYTFILFFLVSCNLNLKETMAISRLFLSPCKEELSKNVEKKTNSN